MKNFILGMAALLLAAHGQAATEQNKASSAILLQGFHWNSWNGGFWYRNLEAKALDFRDLGVTHVWFPPPSNSGAREGYLPRELYNLQTAYGSEEQLRGAIAALNREGIQAVADIVINHRVGSWNFADFNYPNWGCDAVANNDEWPGRCGGNDSGTSYSAARDIDHSNSVVQNDIKYFLSERLRSVGFTGWRYDYSKGYSPYYARIYNEASTPNFCVGEVWPGLDYNNVDAHRQELMNYVDGTGATCGAFDFTSKGLLNKVLRDNDYWRLRDGSGRPAGGIGWWSQKMVTFVDNHDTGPSESCTAGQNMWPVPCDKVMQGYAYVLTHPGVPSIYYPHVYDWGLKNSIKSLINARRSVGVLSTSAISIQKAENGLYAAIVNGSTGRLAMKIGPNDWSPGAGWELVTWGNQYAVWTQK
jgi:alpha-amylase